MGKDALCSSYSKDGYHFLALNDPSFIENDEIMCHVENDFGFVHKVVVPKALCSGKW